MYLKFVFSVLVSLSFLSLSGCKHGGADAREGEYTGTWNAIYDFNTDYCDIQIQPNRRFTDVQQVVEQDGFISIKTNLSAFDTLMTGAIGEDRSFVAEDGADGELFADGVYCELRESLSYSPTDEDSAATVFTRSIDCADDYHCESSAVGKAIRTNNSTPPTGR